MKFGLISASLAILLAGGALACGVSAFSQGNEVLAATPKTTKPSTSSSVPYPEVYTLKGVEGPVGISFKRFVNDNQTVEQAKKTIKRFHQQIDSWVGFGNYKTFYSDDKNGKWSSTRSYDEMNPKMIRYLATVLHNIQGAEIDLNRLADLAEIAQKKNDVQTVIYMHRILHDLDYFALTPHSHGDYWGVSETAIHITGEKNGIGNIDDIVSYIENKHK
jgi:hypothetical protein